MTKASGLTDKVGTTGGSKGIGKYASFVASSFNTVFYSTYAKDGKKQFLGISKLCSAPMPDTDELTMGIGYYGVNNKNEPIERQLNLDKNFSRNTYGTDLFIIGFKAENNWKQHILSMLLDSFLVAVYYNELEIRIGDIVVNKESLKEIIEKNEWIIRTSRKSIVSQYILISKEEGVYTKEIDILGYGKVKVFAKSFGKEESEVATNNCTMIRYPYMKIKVFPNISTLPCSAMCIIQDNALNGLLKDIENPQHTDWEPNRKEEGALRTEIRSIIQNLRSSIIDFVVEVLSTSETEKLDIEGAGDYLPESDSDGPNQDSGEQEKLAIKDNPVIIKKIKNKKFDKNPIIESQDLEGIAPDIGEHNEDGDDSLVPSGINNGGEGEPHESDDRQGSSEEGDKDIIKHIALTDMKKIFFVSDKNNGEYVVCIDSNYNESDCELEMYYFDDADNQYTVNIESCIVNGQKSEINNGRPVKFKILPGKTKIVLKTDLRDYYRCEVKLYANR